MKHIRTIVIPQDPSEKLRAVFSHKGLRLATAESCTGGLVGALVTATPGSSAVYAGGFVTYTNQMKIDLLGVDPAWIESYTEVSAPVATAMAQGARKRTGADIAVSLTGLAGPGTGNEQTPVGTVYIGVSTPARTYAVRYCMPSYLPRHEIRSRAALLSLTLAIREADQIHN